MDDTQNGILISLIEGDLEPKGDKLCRPIAFDDFLQNSFPYNLVHWNIDDLAKFFIKQDKEIYQYESTFPRFNREKGHDPCLLDDIKNLKKENEKIKAELLERDQKIKELESLNQKDKTDLLSLIFDKTATDRYAPDLVFAIGAWRYIYIDNPKADSHNNKANTWIAKNTPYSGEQEDTATRRLREVISPYSEWRDTRKKVLKND